MTAFQAAKAAAKAFLIRLLQPRAESTPVATLARGLVDPNGVIQKQARQITLTAAATLDVSDSGALILLNLAGGFTVTLPAPAAGLAFDFLVKTAPTTAYIVSSGSSNTDIIIGHVLSSSGAAEDTEATAGGDVVNFVASTAVAGDRLKLESDGTYWYASAICAAAGGITITG